MLRAFRWNLRVLSYISLVVGAFLIYNTISVSVVRRRAEIGVLRAVGAARPRVLGLFLAEAALFGVAGAAIGVVLGRVLAGGHGGPDRRYRERALYHQPARPDRTHRWRSAGADAHRGAGRVGQRLAPAREAMLVAPTEAMSRGAREHHARLRWRRGLVVGSVLAASLAASQATPSRQPIGGYAAALLAIGAAALAAPAIVIGGQSRRASACRVGALETLLAGRSLTASLSRTQRGGGRAGHGDRHDGERRHHGGQLSRDGGGVARHPAARRSLRAARGACGGRRVSAARPASRSDPADDRRRGGGGRLPRRAAALSRRAGHARRRQPRHRAPLRPAALPRGEDRDAILRSLPSRPRDRERAVRQQASTCARATASRLPIGERNVDPDDRRRLLRLLEQPGFRDSGSLDAAAVSARPARRPTRRSTSRPAPTREAVQRDAATAHGGVRSRAWRPIATLRRDAIEIFDRTFAITWALEAVAIVVAMLGAANSLLALVLDRRRELGLLRYLGASAQQIRRMILTEAALLGALAILLGLALGFALSLLLIFVVNKQSFGWTIQFHPPLGLLGGALLLVWVRDGAGRPLPGAGGGAARTRSTRCTRSNVRIELCSTEFLGLELRAETDTSAKKLPAIRSFRGRAVARPTGRRPVVPVSGVSCLCKAGLWPAALNARRKGQTPGSSCARLSFGHFIASERQAEARLTGMHRNRYDGGCACRSECTPIGTGLIRDCAGRHPVGCTRNAGVVLWNL